MVGCCHCGNRPASHDGDDGDDANVIRNNKDQRGGKTKGMAGKDQGRSARSHEFCDFLGFG